MGAIPALLVVLLWSLGCCSYTPAPRVPALEQASERPVVVLVPGITGSRLCTAEGQVAWGSGKNLLVPKDGGRALALPLDQAFAPEPELQPESGQGDGLASCGVLERVRMAGTVCQDVYGPLAEAIAANGFRRGKLVPPEASADLFLYSYDWRRDNVGSARRLRQQLDGLRQARGVERLPVALVCQSNGAHVCRYLAKYGGASLEQAESGEAGPPPELDIQRIVLVGTSNGGSLRILRELHRGRSYLPLIGRKIQPEVMFTYPSVYQDLPAQAAGLFLDPEGHALEVDLYDAQAWQQYGWSIFSAAAQQRLSQLPASHPFADTATQLAFLEEALGRARRLQRLLARDVDGFETTRYYLIQNVYRETPQRAVLHRTGEDGAWDLLFSGDKELRENSYLHSLASAPGDGHATLSSQMALSPQELDSLALPPFYLDGEHFAMVLDRGTHRRLLDFLADGLRPGDL